MKNKLKLAYCLALFLCISSQIANAQTQYPAYDSNHECKDSRYATTGICGLLNKIRSNGNPSTTTSNPEVLLAAHRGSWGGDIAENTQKAFLKAINISLVKLLEADIMPAGVGNYTNSNLSTFGSPSGMVCFHDFKLKRMTTSSSTKYVFEETIENLTAMTLKKPRSEDPSDQKICTVLDLVKIAYNNNVVACLDVKNIENKGSSELTQWSTPERKLLSLTKNLKWIINNLPEAQLRNVAIKTYENHTNLYNKVTQGETSSFITKFNKVLWIPMIANNDIFKSNNIIDVGKVNAWLRDWGAVNRKVLYYEVNISSTTDITARLLEPLFLSLELDGGLSVCEAINRTFFRRVGIFSEEPVGSKGTVNRWGDWKYKDPKADRRGDPLWLMNDIPEMKKGVITTDRPDVWEDSINTSIPTHL